MLRTPAEVLPDLIHVDGDVLVVDRRRARSGRDQTGENRPAETINSSEKSKVSRRTWWWFCPRHCVRERRESLPRTNPGKGFERRISSSRRSSSS